MPVVVDIMKTVILKSLRVMKNGSFFIREVRR